MKKDIDLGLDEKEHLSYISTGNGKREAIDDDRFIPRKDNFHKLRTTHGFGGFLLDCHDEVLWQQSKRYNDLVDELLKEGIEETKRLIKIKEEVTIEKVIEDWEWWYQFYKTSYDEGSDFDKKYCSDNLIRNMNICKEKLDNPQKAFEEKIKGLIGKQCSLDYRIALYNEVFCKGRQHFIDLTMKYGHIINGVEIISYMMGNYSVPTSNYQKKKGDLNYDR